MQALKKATNWCGKGVKPKFTLAEDQRLGQLVEKYGKKSWVSISKKMSNKSPKQCRERFENYVNPKISNSDWTDEEEKLLISKFEELGPHWVKLAKFFKTRSVNNIRNRWLMLRRRGECCHPKDKMISSASFDLVSSPDNTLTSTSRSCDIININGVINAPQLSIFNDVETDLEESVEKNFAKNIEKSDNEKEQSIEVKKREEISIDIFNFMDKKLNDSVLFQAHSDEFEVIISSLYPYI